MLTPKLRIAAVVLVTAALIVAWSLWLRLEPSERPDDVELRGKLLPIASLQGAKPSNGETMAAEVQIKRDAGADLPEDYLYVYVPGTRITEVHAAGDNHPDAMRPNSQQELLGLVRSMLGQIGLSVSAGELREQLWQYNGNQPGYTVQLYLKPDSSGNAKSVTAPENALAYAVYVHQERKWGKNVSWTKAVKLSS